MAVHDVLVLGAGPAGLTLAAACAQRGLDTACLDPEPEGPWSRRFGAWDDELDGTLQDWVEADWAAPSILTRARGEQMLDRRYALFDTVALQAGLIAEARRRGVLLVHGEAAVVEHASTGSAVSLTAGGDSIAARLVVDCTADGRFVRRPAHPSVTWQVGYGELIEVASHPYDLGEMVLMDWREAPGARPTDPPTFLHVLPLGRQLLLVQETSLVSRPAVPQVALRSRLQRRLQRSGITAQRTVEVTQTLLPMDLPLPDRGQRTLAFGRAASMVHPATGYTFAGTWRRAPEAAEGIVAALDQRNDLDAAAEQAWAAIWPEEYRRRWELYAFGGRFLTTLDQRQMEGWFETFFALPVAEWGGFLSATLTSSQIAQVMTRMYGALDPHTRWALMRAGASHHGVAALRATLGR